MEGYLRTIGFSNICSKKQIDNLLGEIMTTPTFVKEKSYNNKEKHIELSKVFSDGIGITICGYYDNKSFFHLDHYHPFIINNSSSIQDELCFNKKIDKVAYSCLCDDTRLGVTLTFYLQNVVDYMITDLSIDSERMYSIGLSGLCTGGKILLPVVKNIEIRGNKFEDNTNSSKQINYKQDIYTLVENSFYPKNDKYDCYSVVGTIKKVEDRVNYATNEEMFVLVLECKGVPISIVINKKDLIGIPSIGTRFKGDIWLQGYVDFSKKMDICKKRHL